MAPIRKASILENEERQERGCSNSMIGVDKDGMVHALREGNAVITVKVDGVKDKVRVTVQLR